VENSSDYKKNQLSSYPALSAIPLLLIDNKGLSQTFSFALQASYFLAQFFLGSSASTSVNSHLTLLTWLRNHCTNLKEINPSA